MKDSDQSEHLPMEDALSRFESCLMSPLVPGELRSWASGLVRICDELGEPLRREIEVSHREQFAEIRRTDPDLFRRVEQLRNEDSRLLKFYVALRGQIEQFLDRAERDEPHESKLNAPRTALVDEGLTFVIQVRKQEESITTWFMEAHQRDRGVAD